MAMEMLARVQDFAGWLAQGKIALPNAVMIPASHCMPPGSAGADIVKDRDYITININELFLSEARKGWVSYDPMVLVTTSFIYDGKRISVPAVVGPGLLERAGHRLPQGVVLQDTTVVGPYPYCGGPVAISIAFYRVRNRDYARDLLSMVESVAAAVGPAADIGVLSKFGTALIDGANKLIGMAETEPLAGHRIEFSPVKPGGLRTAFCALTCGDVEPAVGEFRVADGRLRTHGVGDDLRRYDASDYVLYSITASSHRDDESTLPLYRLYRRALEDAARGENGWAAAKSTFAELWQQLLVSPDLTKAQARDLRESWKQDLLSAREVGDNTRMMSAGRRGPAPDERLAGAAEILSL